MPKIPKSKTEHGASLRHPQHFPLMQTKDKSGFMMEGAGAWLKEMSNLEEAILSPLCLPLTKANHIQVLILFKKLSQKYE